jgi:predicted PurR-regulated permease PerM
MDEQAERRDSAPAAELNSSQPAPPHSESLVAVLDRVADPSVDSKWDLSTKRTVLVILLIVVVFVIYISRSILPMVLIAAILAYLLSPIINFAQRFRIPRIVSTLVVFLLIITLLVLVPIIFIPTLVDQLRALATFDATGAARAVINWANDTVQGLPETIVVLGYPLPVAEYVRQVQSNSQQVSLVPSVSDILGSIQQFLSTTTNVVSSTASFGINVVNSIFSIFVGVLVTFFVSLYMTMDAPKIQAYFHSLFPTSYRSELADLLRRIGAVWQSFLRGQLILSITVGTTTWLVLSLVGMPGALIFGILAGLLEVVPNLGPILAMIPAVITALLQGSNVLEPLGVGPIAFALITVGIYFLIQQLENNILVPRIIGDSINLHPIVVICAVAVGFSIGNILGALLAPPIVATSRVVGSYIHAKLLDYPPFQGRPAPASRTYRRTVSGESRRLSRRTVRREPDARVLSQPASQPVNPADNSLLNGQNGGEPHVAPAADPRPLPQE